MKYICIIISIFFFLTTTVNSDITEQIIETLKKSDNYSFKFNQQINDKNETGNCILVFNRKINCSYDKTGKILISDGENLIIKDKDFNNPNFYKLKNTSFYKLLDKEYLISELEKRSIINKKGALFFNANYQGGNIKVFFDINKLHLKGWRTKDVYNNSVDTEIIILEINKVVNEDIFDIKKFN